MLFLRKKHSNNLANTLRDTKRWKKVPSGKKDKITYSRTCLVGRSVLFSWPLTRKRWLSPADVCPLPYLGNCRDYFNLMFWTAQGKRSQVIQRYRETDKARKCREFLSSLHSSVKQLKAQNNVRNGFTASSLCSIIGYLGRVTITSWKLCLKKHKLCLVKRDHTGLTRRNVMACGYKQWDWLLLATTSYFSFFSALYNHFKIRRNNSPKSLKNTQHIYSACSQSWVFCLF